MSHNARDYQQRLIDGAFSFWTGGGRKLLIVLPTGGGKTFVFARIASLFRAPVCAIAHRGELVAQISLALAREGVRHRVIGSKSVQSECRAAHRDELGVDYVDPVAYVAVASVDTLVKMQSCDPWFASVRLWVQDEAHHVLKSNKWGTATRMFTNALGLGVTATPVRADGKGLGEDSDGVFEEMLVGPTMRELIDRRYLTDYRIFAPPSDLDLSQVPVSASGDFSPPKLADARKRSHITGDVVQHYLRIARGRLGVTFDVDVESATQTAEAYRAAGVPAAVVHGGTEPALRRQLLRQFRNREILQLVNVDLFGEGFDLPAIEVVSMARPTQSYALFAQQFGRALRPLEGKDRAIIIDHVGNVLRHGLPDSPRRWSLDRRERRSRTVRDDVIPTRVCLNPTCVGVFERVLLACPYCGTVPVPAGRSAPEQVDGDLTELDPAVLARLRGEAARIVSDPVYPSNAGPEVRGAIRKTHLERRQAQERLREVMQIWGGWQEHLGRPLNEGRKRFFFTFGIDVATATTLGAREATDLAQRVQGDLNDNNVVGE